MSFLLKFKGKDPNTNEALFLERKNEGIGMTCRLDNNIELSFYPLKHIHFTRIPHGINFPAGKNISGWVANISDREKNCEVLRHAHYDNVAIIQSRFFFLHTRHKSRLLSR